MKYLYLYLVIINALGFLLMLADKEKARRGAWRISERTLLTVAAVGGSLGSLLGMKLFRHKTKHLKFTVTVPVLLVIHIVILIFLYR